MRNIWKKIMVLIAVVFAIMQLIRPERNLTPGPYPNDISNRIAVPAGVSEILHTACYDCHSDSTSYPWYANIQPVGWWLQDHVNEGKDELNFHAYKNYTTKRARHKLEEIAEQVLEEEMPLQSYTIIHAHARLTAEQRKLLADWAKASMKTFDSPELKEEDSTVNGGSRQQEIK